MASMNKVIILGRLGRDPETRATASGSGVCSFSVATSRATSKGADGNKKEETEWHNVTVFGKPAEIAQRYLKKGSEVLIEGRMHYSKYTGRDGVEKTRAEVICESLQLGARPGTGAGTGDGGGAQSSPAPGSAAERRGYQGGFSGGSYGGGYAPEVPF